MIAILILIIFTILMWNLYARLTKMEPLEEKTAPAPEASSGESSVLLFEPACWKEMHDAPWLKV